MGVASKPLYQGQLSNAQADLYTAPGPAPGICLIQNIFICNTDSVTHWVTLRIGSGSLTAANSLYEQKLVPANETVFLSGSGTFLTAMFAGWKISGLSDVSSKITVTIAGDEIV
jgi:hypothetical protein